MGAKKVDFPRLAAALRDYRFAYLLTVDDNSRVHTVAVEPVLADQTLDVGLIGEHTRKNLASRSTVTLLWPPSQLNGYSLIVDGRAELSRHAPGDQAVRLSVTPTRALLHRNADPQSAAVAEGCRHDCVVFAEA
ncbi:MAG: pyridoxamine 5'-phosphate oxidase family protein [Mycobacteriaceae bacterium]|nr:pyridoxamine 5'-phosphate oxidase family protein [Mycobacteriaceae bacterium]